MKPFINLIFLIALITLVKSLTTGQENQSKFLKQSQNGPNLAELLSKTNMDKTTGDGSASPMENSGYLFYGYNMFYGNPHSTTGSIDPGFTNPVFKTSYESNHVTGDLRFMVPDGAVLGKNVGCDVSMSSSVIKDASSYKTSLEAEISGGASWGIGSFSASASFKAVLQGSSSSEEIFVESKSDCRVFTGHLNYYLPPKIDETFIKAIDYIDELNFEESKENYFTFIDYFGTHFINSVEMGARYGYLEKTTAKEQSSGTSISASLSVSGSYGVGSASAKVGGGSDKTTSGSNKSKNVKIFSIGVPPPSDGNALTWAEKSLLEPMPIKYGVRPITDIFTNRYFDLSGMQDPGVQIDLPKFVNNLNSAMKAYCSEHLKPKGATKFCTEDEFKKLVEEIRQIKIEDGVLIKIRNTYKDLCVTFIGGKTRLILQPCSLENNDQIFKLKYVSSINAFKVVTRGPQTDGQWEYSQVENRLKMWDYGDDNKAHRHFTFTKERENVFKIRNLSNNGQCMQAIPTMEEIHWGGGCENPIAEFTISNFK